MTATVRPSPLVDGEFSGWCRICKDGSGFGLTERAAREWTDNHNHTKHPGEAEEPTLDLGAAARDLLHLRLLGLGHAPESPEAQRYDAALALWCTLLRVPFEKPDAAVQKALKWVDGAPAHAAVVPF